MTGARPAWPYWLPAASWAALLFALSSRSWLPGPPGDLTDKHVHAGAYAVLAVACLYGAARGRLAMVTAWRSVIAVLLAVAYGASDELHQAFVPGRTADLLDLAADAAGAVIGVAAVWACAILLRGRDPRA